MALTAKLLCDLERHAAALACGTRAVNASQEARCRRPGVCGNSAAHSAVIDSCQRSVALALSGDTRMQVGELSVTGGTRMPRSPSSAQLWTYKRGRDRRERASPCVPHGPDPRRPAGKARAVVRAEGAGKEEAAEAKAPLFEMLSSWLLEFKAKKFNVIVLLQGLGLPRGVGRLCLSLAP